MSVSSLPRQFSSIYRSQETLFPAPLQVNAARGSPASLHGDGLFGALGEQLTIKVSVDSIYGPQVVLIEFLDRRRGSPCYIRFQRGSPRSGPFGGAAKVRTAQIIHANKAYFYTLPDLKLLLVRTFATRIWTQNNSSLLGQPL